MRFSTTLFLLLALSLPALAHHDRDDERFEGRRRIVVEDCGPRVFLHGRRALTPDDYPPMILRRHRHWREYRRAEACLPPPPVILRPRARIWIGF